MSYYICEEHKRAFESLRQWAGHWMNLHKGEQRPPDETVLAENVPEDYELRGEPQHTEPNMAEELTPPEKSSQKPSHKRPQKPPENPPENPPLKTKPVYGPAQNPNHILEEILTGHPDLPEKAVQEVLRWMKYKDFLHPNEVSWILSQISDVPKGTPGLVQMMYSLALSNAQTPGAAGGGVSPGAFGGPSPGLISPGFPWGGGLGIGPQGLNLAGPQQPTPESPAMLELRQQMATMSQDMANLISRLEEKERAEAEEKREAQHKAELQALQDGQAKDLARVEAANKEAIERLEKANKEAIEGLREMLKGKGESPEGADLRSEVSKLRDELREAEARGFEQQVADLKARLDTAEKREPSSDPTELGVMRDLGKDVVDAAREAGLGLRDVVLGIQKGAILPQGLTPEQRAATGKELLDQAGKNAEKIAKMDKFFATG